MSLPTLFLGSSKESIEIANLFKLALSDCAEISFWPDGVFGLNENYLEALLTELNKCEFAAFVLAGDDKIESRDESKLSPRDNILFEGGMFMGALGRNNTFLIYDQAVNLKLPSDLAGITLATYDGKRINHKEANDTIKKACDQIRSKINEQRQRFPYLSGKWKSIYPLPFDENKPNEEIVEIAPFRDGISISTIPNTSSTNDYYKATGKIVDRKIFGEWHSRAQDNDSSGIFMLIIEPNGRFMYGYFTGQNEKNGVLFVYWALTKFDEAGEENMKSLLGRAKKILKESTLIE